MIAVLALLCLASVILNVTLAKRLVRLSTLVVDASALVSTVSMEIKNLGSDVRHVETQMSGLKESLDKAIDANPPESILNDGAAAMSRVSRARLEMMKLERDSDEEFVRSLRRGGEQ